MEGLMMIVTSIAEAVRFELTIPFGMPPFQGGGINHYPTPPLCEGITTFNKM